MQSIQMAFYLLESKEYGRLNTGTSENVCDTVDLFPSTACTEQRTSWDDLRKGVSDNECLSSGS